MVYFCYTFIWLQHSGFICTSITTNVSNVLHCDVMIAVTDRNFSVLLLYYGAVVIYVVCYWLKHHYAWCMTVLVSSVTWMHVEISHCDCGFVHCFPFIPFLLYIRYKQIQGYYIFLVELTIYNYEMFLCIWFKLFTLKPTSSNISITTTL